MEDQDSWVKFPQQATRGYHIMYHVPLGIHKGAVSPDCRRRGGEPGWQTVFPFWKGKKSAGKIRVITACECLIICIHRWMSRFWVQTMTRKGAMFLNSSWLTVALTIKQLPVVLYVSWVAIKTGYIYDMTYHECTFQFLTPPSANYGRRTS